MADFLSSYEEADAIVAGYGSNAIERRERLLRDLADFGTSERLTALDTLRALIQKADRDARLLDGRDYDAERFLEAYRLLDLLRAREERA